MFVSACVAIVAIALLLTAPPAALAQSTTTRAEPRVL
jgi:hypothetical protein